MTRTLVRIAAVAVTSVAPAAARDLPAVAAPDTPAPPSIVEDHSYPDAEGILARHGLKLAKGDGHILFHSARTYDETECAAGLLQVEKSLAVEPYGMYYCFRTVGTTGFLTLEVPGAFGVRGGSTAVTAKAQLPDGTTLPPYQVDPDERVAIRPGTGGEPPRAILVELRMT